VTAPYAAIACCIDDSPGSECALEEAERLRALGPGRLELVHVAPLPALVPTGPYGALVDVIDLRDAAGRWLEERARRVPGATAVLLEGHPARAVCDHAAEAGVDLVVAGAHRGLVERAVLGSFAAYVAYHAPCPVLLVHPPRRPRPGGAGV
jgi:nucleotide-binding universal stress UspA family protein